LGGTQAAWNQWVTARLNLRLDNILEELSIEIAPAGRTSDSGVDSPEAAFPVTTDPRPKPLAVNIGDSWDLINKARNEQQKSQLLLEHNRVLRVDRKDALTRRPKKTAK
jgi:hypothetical protein